MGETRLMTSSTPPVKTASEASPSSAGQDLIRRSLKLSRSILDRLYPPVCLHCGSHIGVPDSLCASCWIELRPITRPFCPVLGLPFEADLGPDVLSAQAIAEPPPFRRARSAVIYGEVARSLVSRLKFGDHTELARFCARMMVNSAPELFEGNPLLVPVPLHRRRQWQRRYNQSALLAEAIAAETGLESDPFIVMRSRPTRQQVGLNAAQRQRNVQGAFTAHPDFIKRCDGRPLLIVDDVITTASTTRAVTHALQRGGAVHIDVISFARVVTGSDALI